LSGRAIVAPIPPVSSPLSFSPEASNGTYLVRVDRSRPQLQEESEYGTMPMGVFLVYKCESVLPIQIPEMNKEISLFDLNVGFLV
jgi:hypothetical protein